MPDKRHRKLQAIIFADIAGYTEMMQHDERLALQALSRFKETIEANAIHHQGSIVQYYGDGCLLVFDSPIDAVLFAKALQTSIRSGVSVPVRVGIHLGDVVFEDDNAFGDCVNIASRIESLGVPGAVLFSQAIKNQIRNHPELPFAFVGVFDFKNVDDPMEVYALAMEGFPVPVKGELTGKLKTPVHTERKPFDPISSWWWILIVAGLMAVGAIYFNSQKDNIASPDAIEKSIAVLPFKNLSEKGENQFFCDGMMETILNNLSQLGDLRVVSRTTMEQYRKTDKSLPMIARELDVSTILEGSVQRYGDNMRISAQLIHVATDAHLWSNSFDETVSIENILSIQTKVAQAIADALKIELSSEEKDRISTLSTHNLDAYNFYLQGQAYLIQFADYQKDEQFENAVQLFYKAIQLDSNFALPYAALGESYLRRVGPADFLSQTWIDSLFLLSGKALRKDPDLPDGYWLRGVAYQQTGMVWQAEADYKEAIRLNPNHPKALRYLGHLYCYGMNDYVRGIPLLHRSIKVDKSYELPRCYVELAFHYLGAGDTVNALQYVNKSIELRPDFMEGWELLAHYYTVVGNTREEYACAQKMLQLDSSYARKIGRMALALSDLGRYDEANEHFEQSTWKTHRYAYSLFKAGKQKEALLLFETQKQRFEEVLNRKRAVSPYYDLAGIYAFLGDKKKALKCLLKLEKEGFVWGAHIYIHNDPLFEILWKEDEFIELMQRVEEEKAQIRKQIVAALM